MIFHDFWNKLIRKNPNLKRADDVIIKLSILEFCLSLEKAFKAGVKSNPNNIKSAAKDFDNIGKKSNKSWINDLFNNLPLR